MKHSSITYRFFSALTVMLLLSTIAVPATISAASLFCDMEITAMHGAEQSCCTHLNSDDINNQAVTKASKDCSFQKVCEHAISDSQSDIQAVQQITKETVVVVLADKLYSPSEKKLRHSLFNHIQPLIKESPPIFLLNSSFLN